MIAHIIGQPNMRKDLTWMPSDIANPTPNINVKITLTMSHTTFNIIKRLLYKHAPKIARILIPIPKPANTIVRM